MSKYDYFIAGGVDSSILENIVIAQVTLQPTFLYIDTITTNVEGVDGDQVSIFFSGNLSQPDQDTLTSAINTYNTIAPIQISKAATLASLQNDIQNFIESKYSFRNRMQFMNLYTLAKFDSLPNRATYIRQGIDWMNVIVAYGVSVAATIQAAASVVAIEAITWDIAGHSGVNPNISLGGAFSINS